MNKAMALGASKVKQLLYCLALSKNHHHGDLCDQVPGVLQAVWWDLETCSPPPACSPPSFSSAGRRNSWPIRCPKT